MECMSSEEEEMPVDEDHTDSDAGSASGSDDSGVSEWASDDGDHTSDGNDLGIQDSDCSKLADLFLRLKDSHEPRVEVCNSNGATGSSTKRLLARLLTLNA